jgi:hypothetical protein
MEIIEKDIEHIKLLSIFHYVYAGISAIFGSFPLIHVAIGISVVLGGFAGGKDPMPMFVGWFFIAVGSILVLIGWGVAIANFLAARRLREHRNRLFCLIVAGIDCAFLPAGTVLGVFTFIVLLREPVKQLFEGRAIPELQPAATLSMTPPDWR